MALLGMVTILVVFSRFELPEWLGGLVRPSPQDDPRPPWGLAFVGFLILAVVVVVSSLAS